MEHPITGTDLCPCGSGNTFADCCEALLTGNIAAATAEELMRSRYTAYVTRNAEYLQRTWQEGSRPRSLSFEPGVRWLGLKIIHSENGQPGDATGRVEFVARHKINGRGFRLHEISRFECIDGSWIYIDGERLAR